MSHAEDTNGGDTEGVDNAGLDGELVGRDERGMTTAELLGNAALGVLALVVIWGLLQTLGVDIVRMIRGAVL